MNTISLEDAHLIEVLRTWQKEYPEHIVDVRGKGLLAGIECRDRDWAARIDTECLKNRLFVRVTQETFIRIFPALIITREELDRGLEILKVSMDRAIG